MNRSKFKKNWPRNFKEVKDVHLLSQTYDNGQKPMAIYHLSFEVRNRPALNQINNLFAK